MSLIVTLAILYLADMLYKKYKKNKTRNLTKNLIIAIYSREENETPERRQKLESAARWAMFMFQTERGELFDRWLDCYPRMIGLVSNFEEIRPGYGDAKADFEQGNKIFEAIFENRKKEYGL